MGVRIDKISVKNLGPIQNFSGELSLLNLIYSPNGKGKTFLTEFIIHSLFKNIKRWYLRKGGNGKVWISGLSGSPVEFSPLTKKKLEDYWEKDKSGLPPSMVKILVSKGAESSIEETDEGISKNFMKEILSGISLLDKIDSDNNISRTVKSAELKNSEIIMDRRGGKDYYSLKEGLEGIDNLFTEINAKYIKGIIETYKIQEKSLQEGLEKLNKAKRHEAYLISEKIKGLEAELNKVSEEELNQVALNISEYKNLKESHNRLDKEKEELQRKGKHFSWLQNALPEYKELTTNIIKKPSSVFLFIAIILAFVTVVLLTKQDKQVAIIISFLGTLGLVSIYIKKLYDFSKRVGQNEELNKIKMEFKNRTGKELTDVAFLETVLKEQESFIIRASVIGGEIKKEGWRDIGSSIEKKLSILTGKEIEESEWDITVKDLKEKHRSLRGQIDVEKKKLHNLSVDETDYLREDAEIRYSQEEFNKIILELKKIKNEIVTKENEIQNLKAMVCGKTGDDLSIGWEQLLENLHEERLDKQKQLNELEARITAGIVVYKVISKLRNEEDTKIREGLESEIVLKPLNDLTQRYNRLVLEGDTLIVSNDYNNFALKDLSTGEKEQVMLALRIGFSSKLLKQDSLFLILDDAFQHTDWGRRKTVVKQLADITKKGWQIIYLTMDNHIKELFDEVGKGLGESYKSLVL